MPNRCPLLVSCLAFALLTATFIFTPGCAKSTPGDAPGAVISGTTPLPVNTDGWAIRETRSPDGGVRYTRADMPAALQERVRNSYRKTTLMAVPVDPTYNVSLFRIEDVEAWKSVIFIAPRLYAYGNAQGGRVAPERHEDGTVSISFPVILTDGTQAKVAQPSEDGEVTIPEWFQIKSLPELRTRLHADTGGAYTLSPLVGCPKRLLLRINAEEIDVTPSDLAFGDYCQLNKPFNVTARLPEARVRYMFNEGLKAGAVEIRAVYETRVPFIVSKATVSFDKAKLFRAIEAEVKVNAGTWADVDAQAHITNIVRGEAMTVEIEGDVTPMITQIVQQATAEFFIPYKPDPTTTGLKECGNAAVCLRFNYNSLKENETFNFSWAQKTTELTGQNYLTWTQLVPLQDTEVMIGGGTHNADNTVTTRAELSNKFATGIETGLTVLPGDTLIVTPAYLLKETHELPSPKVVRTHPGVCVPFNGFSRPELLGHPWCEYCHSHSEPICSLGCANQGECLFTMGSDTDTTYYYSVESRFEKIDQPIGQMPHLWDGLALRFVSKDRSGASHDVTCPVTDFATYGDARSLTLSLENQVQCRPFTEGGKTPSALFLVNRLTEIKRDSKGPIVHTQVNDWGRTFDLSNSGSLWFASPSWAPEIKFAGKIAIHGTNFGSARPQGQPQRQ